MTEPSAAEFTSALVEELASSVGRIAGVSVATARTNIDAGPGYTMTIAVSGGRWGSFFAWIDRAGARAVTRIVTGLAGDPDDGAVADALCGMWSQAAAAVCLKPTFNGLDVTVTETIGAGLPTNPAGFAMDVAGADTAQIILSGEFEPEAVDATRRATTRATNLEAVLDMELPLVVRFGHTVMSLKALSALGPGSIVSMGRSPDDPVDLLVGQRVIARGEVVIVGGNYGVRITELVGRRTDRSVSGVQG